MSDTAIAPQPSPVRARSEDHRSHPRRPTLRPIAIRTLAGALIAAAALTAAVVATATAQTTGPTLRVHAIFSGGRAQSFHAGEVLMVDVPRAGGRKLTQVCWTPAPIARPDCSPSSLAAPHAGPLTITATLDDGTRLTRTLRIHAPATKVDGPRAVPATITCRDVTLFGNYDRRAHRSHDPRGTIRAGAQVGLFNVIGADKIFMWDYATNLGGFGTEHCART